MLLKVLILIGVTFVPALELRASIPLGIFAYKDSMHWTVAVAICVAANIALAFVFYWLLDTFIKWLRHRWAWFQRVYERVVARAQRKIHKNVERYGEWGVAVFIGIPLPGTGVITGAIASYALGLNRRKYYVASILGVAIAATAVTTLCLFGDAVAPWLLKLFTKKV
jgi:uncharacterized membrane protein